MRAIRNLLIQSCFSICRTLFNFSQRKIFVFLKIKLGGNLHTDLDLNPFPVNLQNIILINGNQGASTIEPPCYVDGFYVFWYQDPTEFYRIWPETQTYQPQRPTGVLYYNNELTFRGPPEKDYLVKIAAYQVELEITNGVLDQDYLYRYICYGTALDIFSDFGEMDKWRDIFQAYQRYRALVYGRTNCQYQNQRPSPEF